MSGSGVKPAESRPPGVGLRSYDTDDSELFFGREPESREVAALWSDNRLLVFHGDSGVGKTSLIQAGVIPSLDRDSVDILPVGHFHQASVVPIAALPEYNPFTFALLSSWAPYESPPRLSGLSIADYLLRRRKLTNRYNNSRPVLAAVDRFEEIFWNLPRRRRYLDEFIAHLAEAIRLVPDLRLLISIREDWLPSLSPYEPVLSATSRTRFRLPPLRPDAAVAAVTGPLRETGRTFAAGVAEHLVHDLRTIETGTGQHTTGLADNVEPTQLQVVFSALWDSLPADVRTITTDHLPSRGHVDHVLADCVTRATAAVSRAHGLPETLLSRWLEQTFVTDLGTSNTVYEGSSLTAGIPNAVTRALEDRHLLRAEWRRSTRWYELANDRWIGAVRIASRAQGDKPAGDAATALRSAEVAFEEGDYDLATRQTEESLHLAENDPRAQAEAESLLGNVAFHNGRYAQAKEHYHRAAERFELLQDSAAVGLLLAAIGRLLLAEGDAAEAVGDLQRAVIRLPGNRMVRIEFARALRHTGQLRGAAGVYGNVLDSDPEETNALAERAQVNAELGEFAAALDDLDNLARLNPELAARGGARSARAVALAQIGRIETATVEAEAAVAVDPDSGPVLARAASVSARAGAVGQAIDLVGRALAARSPGLLPHQVAAARRLIADLSHT
jgi:tetratricopeptide (TPR) repeat protein